MVTGLQMEISHPIIHSAHQITNTGTEDFVFFVIADNLSVNSTYYPESDKWQIKPQRKLFRMAEVDYFDGEE